MHTIPTNVAPVSNESYLDVSDRSLTWFSFVMLDSVFAVGISAMARHLSPFAESLSTWSKSYYFSYPVKAQVALVPSSVNLMYELHLAMILSGAPFNKRSLSFLYPVTMVLIVFL